MSQKKNKLQFVQKYYLRKEDGTIDYEHPYDLIKEAADSNLYQVIQNGQVGYMNENGDLVVPIQYDYTRTSYQGNTRYSPPSWYTWVNNTKIASVYKNNCEGVINDRGEEIVPCEFEEVNVFPWNTSESFIPVALSSQNNHKLLWGMYDVKNKRVSVTPKYEKIQQEKHGYATFKQNNKWGLVHCATGTEVIPADYLLDMHVQASGIVIAFFGGSWRWYGKTRSVNPKDCHVWVVNGPDKTRHVLSGYNWIERTAPSVVKCEIGSHYKPDAVDTFKILRMPDYIALIANATYEAGYFLKTTGEFVKEYSTDCTSAVEYAHAKYISGGMFSAISYDGTYIPVTSKMKEEILQHVRDERFPS